MGEKSKIEWCDHTFNPWWGCVKVAPGCKNCYAESLAGRFKFNVWGIGSDRREFGDKHWNDPVRWNKKAKAAGVRYRVFCGSMCDVFEDHEQLDTLRARLWDLIDTTPHLDWLLLTKRPENIVSMIPEWWVENPLDNVWFGTSITSTIDAHKYIPALLQVPARVRFLSVEPLLIECNLSVFLSKQSGIHWVIVGGESGHGSREMKKEWVLKIRDLCLETNTPFLFKQWGRWYDGSEVGKKVSGRCLDGEFYDGYPVIDPLSLAILCPCGGDLYIIRSVRRGSGGLYSYIVECDSCLQSVLGAGETPFKAVDLWNNGSKI